MVNYNDVADNIQVLENAAIKLSAKVGKFKNAEKVRYELGKIQAIISKTVKPLLLEG